MLKIYPEKSETCFAIIMMRIMMQLFCRTYTMTSMSDGSSSTIMVEEWQPIFDRFDLESDGRMVGIIL